MDLKELKSQAYDLIATIELAQAKLKEINAQILRLAQEKPEEKSE